MKSRTTPRFRSALEKLPERVRRDVRIAYKQFLEDPQYPGLEFKLVNPNRRTYSVRIGIHYRALGMRDGDECSGTGLAGTTSTRDLFREPLIRRHPVQS